MSAGTPAIADLVDRSSAGDRRATGRLLTLVERGGEVAEEIAELTHTRAGSAHIVGVTGPPGSGKSTMVARLVGAYAAAGATPAVLAVDPSSPLTGGAILGDRVRMADVDTVAFIRSVATRGHSGGLALSIPGGVRVLAAAGFDPVMIETVGVGQVEVDVSAAADTTIVVVNPGMGDAVQANKAGLLEVADIFVVNKADQPGARDARRDLELMLDLGPASQRGDTTRRPPILMTNALDGTGIADVHEATIDHLRHLHDTDTLVDRHRHRAAFELRTRAGLRFEARLTAALDDPTVGEIVDAIAAGRRTPADGVVALRDVLSLDL